MTLISPDDVAILRDYVEERRGWKILEMYPETGPLRRELYVKHHEFFRAGKTNRVRVVFAGNRVGKTEGMALCETTHHVTGIYPATWDGHVFPKPIRSWVCGDTNKSVVETLQMKLLGPIYDIGTGLIPKPLIERVTRKSGIPDAVDTIYIKHASGGLSNIVLKSYEQGADVFRGSEQDLIVLDEEVTEDIYVECLIRTMTTKGRVMLVFTPVNGVTPLVQSLLKPGGNHFLMTATWDDAPHLSEQDKAEMLASIPEYQRDARSKGIPSLGSGAVFSTPMERIIIEPFEIPEHFWRVGGIDVGWTGGTAATWGAYDPESQISYVWSDYKLERCPPHVHAASILERGDWFNLLIDPASQGSSQIDGKNLFDIYRKFFPHLQKADNSVEPGITKMDVAFASGKLRIFSTCTRLIDELSYYHRVKGKIVKGNDHCIDSTRYWFLAGPQKMTRLRKSRPNMFRRALSLENGWMN